jgi:undecaprenyl-diphosphatase
MSLWFAALLGLIQGLTEFLPISSTAHLRIAPALLGQPDPGAAFTAVIQLGTLAAVLAYFARDLFVDLPRALLQDRSRPEAKLPIFLVVGTIPIVVLGVTLKDFIVGDARSLWVVSSTLIGVGALMAYIDRRTAAKGLAGRDVGDVRVIDAALIGLAQACALVPGVSRSGATICMALALGMARAPAARFSFLLGIPAIAGAGLHEMKDAVDQLGGEALAPLIVATVVAAVSGYASIAWLLRWLGTRSLVPFAAYRVALGVLLLALCASGVLAP